MASSGRFDMQRLPLRRHRRKQQKDKGKSIWIRAPILQGREVQFALFKLNPEDPKLKGSLVPRAPLPPMPFGVPDWAALSIVGSRLYVLGGQAFTGHKNVSSIDLEGTESNGSSDNNRSSWKQELPLLNPRIDPTCIVVDGKIYVFGGLGVDADRAEFSFAEVFDPTTKKRETLPQIPSDLLFGDDSIGWKVSAAAVTVDSGNGKRYIPVHVYWTHSLLGYCIDDNSWFYLDTDFDRSCEMIVVVDDVIYSFISDDERGFQICAYDLLKRQSLTVDGKMDCLVAPQTWLFYLGNNKFWLFYITGSALCKFVNFTVRKNFRGPELDSISITSWSPGEFTLDALGFDGIMCWISSTTRSSDFEPTTPVGSNSPASPYTPCTPEDTTSSNSITEDEGDCTGTNTINVGQHFKKLRSGTESMVCDYCNKKLEGSSENGTSHLYVHLKRCGNVRRDF